MKIGDRVVVSNPTPQDKDHPVSRSPMWKGKAGTVVRFQGGNGIIVQMDEYPHGFTGPLCFMDYELTELIVCQALYNL